MVKEIDGNGKYFRDLLRQRGIVRDQYRLLNFTVGQNEGERDVALSVLATYPDHDSRSLLFTNVLTGAGAETQILVVPLNTPFLGKDTDALPEKGTIFVADVLPETYKRSRSILILTDSLSSADKIARSAANRAFPNLSYVEFSTKAVSPEEFIDVAKRLIDSGVNVPPTVLKYAGLRKYAEQVKASRISDK